MAETTDTNIFSIKIDGVDRVLKSYKDVKQAQKDLRDSILSGNKDAVKSLADLKDKLEDIGEETNTLKGSGVEKLTSSFSLLSQGIGNFDGDKIKTAFNGIGSAMSAIPIFLLIEGVKLLIENFDSVVAVFESFLGVSKENEIQVKRLTEAIDRESEAIKNLLSISDDYTKNALLQAQALGASEEELEKITRQGYFRRIEAAKSYQEETTQIYNQLLKNNTASAEDLKKAGDAQLQATEQVKKLSGDLVNYQLQTEIDRNKRIDDLEKERLEKYKAFLAKQKAEKEKHDREVSATFLSILEDENKTINAELAAIDQRQKDRDVNKLAGQKLLAEQEKAIRDQAVKEADQSAQESADRAKKLTEDTEKAKTEITKQSFSSAQNLSDAFFNAQLANASGNSKRQLDIAKKQFNINKAFQIAQATMDGYKAFTVNLAAYPAPFGAIAAGIAAVAAAANVAKIASTKFDGGNATASSGPETGGISAPPPPAPSVPNQNGFQTTVINNNGSDGDRRIYVVETDMTETQGQVGKLVRQSKF